MLPKIEKARQARASMALQAQTEAAAVSEVSLYFTAKFCCCELLHDSFC